MTTTTPNVDVQMLLPHEIDRALAARSVVYLPLGSIEYHSHHLPLGVDGLNAHGVCVGAARRTGGVVLPTLWYGTGGSHTTYPWTIMASDERPLVELLDQTLSRLADFGVQQAVLFTGHFAPEQVAMIDNLSARADRKPDRPRVLALSIDSSEAPVAPDHAAVFETAVLYALHPDRVHLDRLPAADVPSPDPAGAVGYDHRHDAEHPLWGVMGPDPRGFDRAGAAALLDHLVVWTADQVEAFIAEQRPAATSS